MTQKFDENTEMVMKVWIDRVALEIGDNPDAPGFVHIRTEEKEAVDYFGKVSISFSTDDARRIASSLIAVADFIDARK